MRIALVLMVSWLLLGGMDTAAHAEPSLEAMAGQMLLVGFRGQTLEEAPEFQQALKDGLVGGVVLFDYDVASKKRGRNIGSPEQVMALNKAIAAAASVPPIIAVDQEGGKVMRLKPKAGFPDWPSAAEIGRTMNGEATLALSMEMGRMLKRYGFTMNFAPVLDVNVHPKNPIIGGVSRSFSKDPKEVALLGTAFMLGLRDGGVLPCIKHFPGHGSSRDDSHLGLPDVSDTWSEAELLPFQAAIDAGAPMVMTAHLFNSHWDPSHPATLSYNVLHNMLRGQLGFKGVIVSDDMQMGAITDHYGMRDAIKLAVNAGVDMLLFGNNLEYDPAIAQKAHGILMELVQAGEIPQERIMEAGQRVLNLKATAQQ